ncbi:transglycosylase SLT domain-containing protein [Pinirhizobacter soli]|uniref:transglycosylase SLT domain-containing protein n=1 Tax=Pinirhizobacter soli TaxID=2786953 RepID=UPI002029FA44|nr:transglycosylase SLT domain-containing protein [Pinirhizobacter soli]
MTHRGRLTILLALAALWLASPVRAATLYRCTGATGETVFASSTAGYKDCKKLDIPVSAPSRHGPVNAKPVAQGVSPASTPKAEPGQKVVAAPQVVAPKSHWDYQESKEPLPIAEEPPQPKAAKVLRGSVYRVTRADGTVEYTNVAPPGTKGSAVTMLFSYIATCVACDIHSKINFDTVALNLSAYADVIRLASAEFGVDQALLRAVIHAESGYNPRALSIKGAQGLMQLMPGTGRDMGVADAFDAEQNIRGGARYLAILLRAFNGDERLAAAAYNAGQRSVEKYNGVPPYAETQVYVERVGILRRRYGAAVRAGAPLALRANAAE